MAGIGIVGAGIGGLHLALFLQRHDVPVTLYTDRTGDEIRRGRLLNTVMLSAQSRRRDRALNVDHWRGAVPGVNLTVSGPQPLRMVGSFGDPWLGVDMRLYLPRLMEEFVARGGELVIGPTDAPEIARLGVRHDLVVVASGRGSHTHLFPRVPERSPYAQAQRTLFAGYFNGIASLPSGNMGFNIAPGVGEIFCSPYLTARGPQMALLFEGIPGQAFSVLNEIRVADEPRRLSQTIIQLLRVHAPAIYQRIDLANFALTDPLDSLQGSVTPTVRRGSLALGNGKFAIALGDAYVSNDPVSGQGANLASRTAWALGEAILSSHTYDAEFCDRVERRMWKLAQPVVDWTNAMLQPPPPHVLALLGAGSQHRSIADVFISNFDAPARQWALISNPDQVYALIHAAADHKVAA